MFLRWAWLSHISGGKSKFHTLLCALENWLPQLPHLKDGGLLCKWWLKSLTMGCVTEGRSLASLSLGFFISKVELIKTHLSEPSAGTVQGLACSKCSIKGGLGGSSATTVGGPPEDPAGRAWPRQTQGTHSWLPPASQGET